MMDTTTYSSRLAPIPNMLISDPPDHERLRKMVAKLFTREAVSPMAQRIQENAERLLEQLLTQGRCDLIADFAGPLTVAMIAQMLGIPVLKLERIRVLTKHSAAYVLALQIGKTPSEESRTARGTLSAMILDIISTGGFEAEGVVAVLAEIYTRGELTQEEIVNFVILLLIAGHSTTTNLIGNAVYMLTQRPADLDRIAEDHTFRTPGIEDVLGMRPSFQRLARVTTRDVELYGELIPKGSIVRLLLGSANRDPDFFIEPEEFDPDTKRRLNSAFGHGIHACLGSWLARLEATTTLATFARQVRSVSLDPECPALELSGGTFNDFGFETLPVLLVRRYPNY